MAVYTYTDGQRHLRPMSRKTQLTLTDRQHAYLIGESIRTGLSMAELMRRAIDKVYRPELRPKVPGFELSLGLWKRPERRRDRPTKRAKADGALSRLLDGRVRLVVGGRAAARDERRPDPLGDRLLGDHAFRHVAA